METAARITNPKVSLPRSPNRILVFSKLGNLIVCHMLVEAKVVNAGVFLPLPKGLTESW